MLVGPSSFNLHLLAEIWNKAFVGNTEPCLTSAQSTAECVYGTLTCKCCCQTAADLKRCHSSCHLARPCDALALLAAVAVLA